MFARTIEAFGPLDILVNNAGILQPCPSHQLESADFDRVIAVNLRGPFLCSREAIRHFLSRTGGGVILNNSSVHEIIPKPKYLSYSISKGGMENLTKTLALEYAGQGIRVNAVGPGAVVTPMNKAWIDNPKARGEVESHIPLGRAADAGEIAAVRFPSAAVPPTTLFAAGETPVLPGRGRRENEEISMNTLESRVTLITGAKGGLGGFVTEAFLAAGAKVAAYRAPFRPATFAPEFTTMPAELSTGEAARKLAADVIARLDGSMRWFTS
jgi:NAD(P)-dependent dehydrogenase (short-subunit alcohol dehydrogenase family)